MRYCIMNEVENYICQFDGETRERLNTLRNSVKELAPDAPERMCMGAVTFDLNKKWLVQFAAFKKHIGFYPDPTTIAAFEKQLKDYKTSKGTVQFPLNKPLPMELIRKMTKYRIKNLTSD